VKGKGIVAIKELQIGDLVKDASGNMVRVYSFGHYQPHTKKIEYLQIHAQGLEKPLEISRSHLVYISTLSAPPVPASLVSIGDKLVLEQGQLGEVTNIKTVTRVGAYAPFTTSGTIVVNGVASSNYVTLQENAPMLLLGNNVWTPLSMHWLAHVSQAPHRMFCGWRMDICQNEMYTDQGISTWVYRPFLACQWLLQQNGIIMAAIFIPFFIVGLLLFSLEFAYLHGFLWLLMAFALCLVAAVGGTPKSKIGRNKKII
jgi:hypothetical protein